MSEIQQSLDENDETMKFQTAHPYTYLPFEKFYEQMKTLWVPITTEVHKKWWTKNQADSSVFQGIGTLAEYKSFN